MALFKTLADKLQQKKTELQEKAAERAAEIALQKGKEAVIGAATTARKRIEEALFGDETEQKDSKPAPKADAAKAEKRNAPTAKVEAKVPRRTADEERAKATEARVRAEARLEKDVDDDLAALKKRIAKAK